MQFGIDSLNIYAGPLSVSYADIAAARGISEKELRATQFRRRSVVPPCEDPVTLAVNAARPILAEHDPSSIGLLIVATETGLDFGKPMSTYVHRHLGLGAHCRNFEVKHACFAGTAALMSALSFVQSESSETKALVIMTDIARAHFTDLAELTGGAGAVALVVSANPRLMIVEPRSGRATQEVFDVARPTPTGEVHDGVLSLYAYLDLFEIAWGQYRGLHDDAVFNRHLRYMAYHTPLVSLTQRAHRLGLESAGDDISDAAAAASFEDMVQPSLRYNLQLGNIYSGSLYAALASLLTEIDVPAGSRVGCFSYGSGSCAEFFSGLVCGGAQERLRRQEIATRLEKRTLIDVPRYEQFVHVV
jgi:3-hydroxy-3-methylglutaryl CoA synthase